MQGARIFRPGWEEEGGGVKEWSPLPPCLSLPPWNISPLPVDAWAVTMCSEICVHAPIPYFRVTSAGVGRGPRPARAATGSRPSDRDRRMGGDRADAAGKVDRGVGDRSDGRGLAGHARQ